MTSVPQCRFALWHHPSQLLQGTIAWRETPKSKALIAVVPPMVLPGAAKVISANANNIELQLSREQISLLHTWLAGLPADVMSATACETGVLQHQGSYVVINPDMSVNSNSPEQGQLVFARITASVRRAGPIRKAILQVIDVLHHDVTANPDEAAH